MKKLYKVKVNGKTYEVELEEIKEVDGRIEETPKTVSKPLVSSKGESVTAPMPGVIVDVKVSVGDKVNEGDLVAVLEAMKMETEIFSSKTGVVSAINADKGTQVQLGDAIITL